MDEAVARSPSRVRVTLSSWRYRLDRARRHWQPVSRPGRSSPRGWSRLETNIPVVRFNTGHRFFG
jgi:hypothetical protein